MKLGYRKTILEDNEENVWIASDAGLLRYDMRHDKMNIYRHETPYYLLSSNIVRTIYQDRTGILWIGTSNGLDKINPIQARFRHLTADNKESTALQDNFVLGIYSEKSKEARIHYFDDSFFSRWNVEDNSIVHYSTDNYNYKDWLKKVMVKNPERLTDSILEAIISYLKKSHIQIGGNGSKFFIDSSKNVWRTENVLLSPLSDKLKKYYDGFIITDAQMHGNEIWMGTAGDGLLCFDIPTRTITKYNVSSGVPTTINSNNITGFVFETNGDIWAGTIGGGLNYFDRSKKIFTHYTEDDGLCNNSIYCLVKDNNDRLWLGTSMGLSCFNPSTKTFRNYFRSAGLINDEYNRNSACLLTDGTVIMGGMNGIDYFNPADLLSDKNKPQVQITDFKIFNESIIPRQGVELTHRQNYITIEFAAMDFTNPSNNKFAYKLQEIDKDWVKLEQRNFINYSLLPPGHYHFTVKAANSDGIWSDTPASFYFTILPPWYDTWWFYTLSALTASGILYFFIRSYVRTRLEDQRRTLEKQQAIALERIRISGELHDDIGGELSAIRLLSEMNTSILTLSYSSQKFRHPPQNLYRK